jgi:dihydropteroate synthase
MLTVEHLAALLEQHLADAQTNVKEFAIGGRPFPFNAEPAIMGVINLSPDSWYRESVCLSVENAVRRAEVLHAQGAHIVDLGAESTLAQAARVSSSNQTTTLVPVIQGLKNSRILISAETYDLTVARACLQAGAHILNLTGVDHSEHLFRSVAEHNAAVILCYVQGKNAREVGDFDFGADPVSLMREHFARSIELALRCGVEKILLDPGLGFYYRNLQDSAVRVRHQMRVFLNTFRLRSLGFPICHALPHAFAYFGEEVRCAEPFFAVLAMLGKTDLFRTHEVPRVRAVLETMRIY